MGAAVKHNIAPLVRKAFMDGIGLIEKDDGRTFPQIMAECIRKNPLATLQAVARFAPKEQHVKASGIIDHNHQHVHRLDSPAAVSAADAIIGEYAARDPGSDDEAPDQDKPVLLDPLRLQA